MVAPTPDLDVEFFTMTCDGCHIGSGGEATSEVGTTEVSLPGLPGLLGIRLTVVTSEHLQAVLRVQDQHMAPNGYLHAACVVALADRA
jgi:acyl-coenzyme A thioesterase PaaI-like protein